MTVHPLPTKIGQGWVALQKESTVPTWATKEKNDEGEKKKRLRSLVSSPPRFLFVPSPSSFSWQDFSRWRRRDGEKKVKA